MWSSDREIKELSKRELQVLQSFASGCSTSIDVAEKLHISQRTVKNHLGSIYKKLDVPNVVGAVLYSLREGMVSFVTEICSEQPGDSSKESAEDKSLE